MNSILRERAAAVGELKEIAVRLERLLSELPEGESLSEAQECVANELEDRMDELMGLADGLDIVSGRTSKYEAKYAARNWPANET